MVKILRPEETPRGVAFSRWSASPMPMVTVTKTFDLTRLVRFSRRKGYRIYMLMTWCIGRAASQVPAFFLVPGKDNFALYDSLAMNLAVKNSKGGLNFCDVPFEADLDAYNEHYLTMTERVASECADVFDDTFAKVGTSTVTGVDLDSAVNQYNPFFIFPFLVWGRFRKQFVRVKLPISMQFHHVQMDGAEIAAFFNALQTSFDSL